MNNPFDFAQDKKGIIIGIVVLALVVGGVLYFAAEQRGELPAPLPPQPVVQPPPVVKEPQTPTSAGIPSLSGDSKSIVADGKVLLVIDDDAIFNFFKTKKSGLCDEYNITTTPDRKMFCENKAIFKSKTRFTSIVSSPDNTKIGFTIESDALSPDKVAGIFYPSRSTDKMRFLTNYYLGNEFISFSPNGVNFVYRGSCWEGKCGLSIKDSGTLAEKINFNNPEYADLRSMNSEFIRWLSDNEVEYKLGIELKQASF